MIFIIVSIGSTVTYISDIDWTEPKPKYWIHIKSTPNLANYKGSDFIADLGGQWKPNEDVQINDACSCNHEDANSMFEKYLKSTNISASDMLLHHMQLFLKTHK